MNQRRTLVIALGAGALSAPLAAIAQAQNTRLVRIGIIGPGSAASNMGLLAGLRAELRALGYVANSAERFRMIAFYVDRILKVAKPADLPVQQPSRFELIINLRAAKAIGLTVPAGFLARADRVIE